jgi:hypothetical protein
MKIWCAKASLLYQAKPIGVPALISLYEKMANDNPLLRQLKVCCRPF